jgi:predicted RNase H-like HicB family nuclease
MPTPEYTVVIERDERGTFQASIEELPESHPSGTTLEELVAEVRAEIERMSGDVPDIMKPCEPIDERRTA